MFRRFGLLNVQTVLKSWLTVFFFHAYLGTLTPFELAFISILDKGALSPKRGSIISLVLGSKEAVILITTDSGTITSTKL